MELAKHVATAINGDKFSSRSQFYNSGPGIAASGHSWKPTYSSRAQPTHQSGLPLTKPHEPLKPTPNPNRSFGTKNLIDPPYLDINQRILKITIIEENNPNQK